MSTTYAQKQSPAQKKDAPTAASILDTSSQSESLQRKADLANSMKLRPINFSDNYVIQQVATITKHHYKPTKPFCRAGKKERLRRYKLFTRINFLEPYTPEFKKRHISNSEENAKKCSEKRLCQENIPQNNVIYPENKVKDELAMELIPVICNNRKNTYKSKKAYPMIESSFDKKKNDFQHIPTKKQFVFGVKNHIKINNTGIKPAVKICHFEKAV
jgi:hypothetical protein